MIRTATFLDRFPRLANSALARRLRSRLATAMAWNGAAAVLARSLPMIGMLIAARLLGAESFGRLGIVYQTVMGFQVFAVAGLGTTATTFVARWRKADPDRAVRLIVMCLGLPPLIGGILVLGLLAGADWLAGVVLRSPELALELRLGGAITVISAVSAVQIGLLIGFQAFRDMAVANLIGGIAAGGGLVLGAAYGGVSGALLGLSAAMLVQVLVNHVLLSRAMRRDGLRWQIALPRSEMRLLWTFSLPSVLTMGMWVATTWGASALLVRQPGGLAEMGLFAAANQWFLALMFIPGVMTQVLLPTYAERLAGERPQSARELALRSAGAILLGISPLVLLLIGLSPYIAALYGPDFAGGAAVFALACVAAGVQAPHGPLTNFLVVRERMWTRLAINLLWSAALLGTAFLLIGQGWGALGIGIAMVFACALRTGITYLRARSL